MTVRTIDSFSGVRLKMVKYLVYSTASLFDWAIGIACYVLVTHWLGWTMLAMALLLDIARGWSMLDKG